MEFLGRDMSTRSTVVRLPDEHVETIRKLALRLEEIEAAPHTSEACEIDFSWLYRFLFVLTNFSDDQLKGVLKTTPMEPIDQRLGFLGLIAETGEVHG